MVLEWYGATSEVPWLFLLAAWIFALVVVAYFYGLWNRAGLRLRLEVAGTRPVAGSPLEDLAEQLLRTAPLPAPIFEGDGMTLEIGLDNAGASRGPAWLRGHLGVRGIAAGTGIVPRSGWRREEAADALRRGPVGATSWQVVSSDPLGFFRNTRRCADSEVALVLPRFASLVSRPQARDLEASVAAPRAGSGTELFGVREYRAGDALRRIHWRASARHGELVVREFEPPGVQTLGIFCDPMPANGDVADQIARLAASEAWDCVREGGRVMLWAPGLEPSLPAEARSFWSLLEWLARYPSEPARGGSDAPLVGEAVAVTGSASVALVEALETVRSRGGRIRAWAVGDAPLDVEPVRRVGTEWPL